MLTDDQLEEFSRSCARVFCMKNSGSFVDYDDASQEAAVILLKRRDLWILDKPLLRRRVLFDLQRWKQNQKGSRRINAPTFSDAPRDFIDRKSEESEDIVASREILDEAIGLAQREHRKIDRDLVERYLDGETAREAAARLGVSVRTIRFRIQSFKTALAYLIKKYKSWHILQIHNEIIEKIDSTTFDDTLRKF